jgi:hypothetical protein
VYFFHYNIFSTKKQVFLHKINFRGDWRKKPESHGSTTSEDGLEGQSPSSCAAGAAKDPDPVNFRRIQRRKERSQYYVLTKLISVRKSLNPLLFGEKYGIIALFSSAPQQTHFMRCYAKQRKEAYE